MHLRTPFYYVQLTSRALTVPLFLPRRLHGDRSPYYSFVAGLDTTVVCSKTELDSAVTNGTFEQTRMCFGIQRTSLQPHPLSMTNATFTSR